jgi:hypothetical protein
MGQSVTAVFGINLTMPTTPAVRVVWWVDSVFNGQGTPNPELNAVFALARTNWTAARHTCFGKSANALIGYGQTAAQNATSVLARLDGTVNNYVVVEDGFNGWFYNTDTLANYQTYWGAFADAINAGGKTGLKIFAIGPPPAQGEAVANGNGWTLPNLRSSIQTVVGTRGSFMSYQDWSQAGCGLNPGNGAQYTDGVHLQAAGAVTAEAYFRAQCGLY